MGAVAYTGGDSAVGSSSTSCRRDEPADSAPAEDHPPVIIRTSIYFDGTGNNRVNTALRRESPTLSHLYHVPGFGASYDNDNTNVEKMERYAESAGGADHFIKLYVEGIGTVNRRSDSARGNIWGSGSTGVVARVNRGLRSIISLIRGRISDPESPVTLHIDAFGFSRGAAAARYYLFQAMEHEEGQTIERQLTDAGFNISSVVVKFAGLFDTVAAMGSEEDDNALHLDAVTHATQVLHLIAADEHRLHFPATDIQSKGNTECYIPGVHSDVGGGYNDNTSEEGLCVFRLDPVSSIPLVRERYTRIVEREKQWLRDKGWYRDHNMHSDWRSITVNRDHIGNQYSYIPLHIMAEHAGDQQLNYNGNLTRRNRVSSELETIKSRLHSYCRDHQGGGSHMNDWANDPTLVNIRHDYFHMSSYYDIIDAMRPQFYSGAHGWNDHDEARIAGTRRRRVYHG